MPKIGGRPDPLISLQKAMGFCADGCSPCGTNGCCEIEDSPVASACSELGACNPLSIGGMPDGEVRQNYYSNRSSVGMNRTAGVLQSNAHVLNMGSDFPDHFVQFHSRFPRKFSMASDMPGGCFHEESGHKKSSSQDGPGGAVCVSSVRPAPTGPSVASVGVISLESGSEGGLHHLSKWISHARDDVAVRNLPTIRLMVWRTLNHYSFSVTAFSPAEEPPGMWA